MYTIRFAGGMNRQTKRPGRRSIPPALRFGYTPADPVAVFLVIPPTTLQRIVMGEVEPFPLSYCGGCCYEFIVFIEFI